MLEENKSELDHEKKSLDDIALAVSELRWMIQMIEDKKRKDSEINKSLLEYISNIIKSLRKQIDDVDHELDKCKIFPD